MFKLIKPFFFAWLISTSFIACNSSKRINKDFTYFQKGMDSLGSVQFKEPVIKPSDILSIQVFSSSLSQEQAAIFNLGNGTPMPSENSNTASAGGNVMATGGTGSASAGNSGYLVSLDGNIEMPIIGRITAAGLTKNQLSQNISNKLESYVKQPNVLVKINSFKVNILGDVNKPGPVFFNNDRANIIDAIAMAGDLKDDARRDNILVIREENGKRISYTVDLRSGTVFESSAFQLQQNDVVYVSSINIKLRSLNADPNSQRNVSIIFASISALAVLLQVFIILFKK
jgi:polysaccharide export outer membrane protein